MAQFYISLSNWQHQFYAVQNTRYQSCLIISRLSFPHRLLHDMNNSLVYLFPHINVLDMDVHISLTCLRYHFWVFLCKFVPNILPVQYVGDQRYLPVWRGLFGINRAAYAKHKYYAENTIKCYLKTRCVKLVSTRQQAKSDANYNPVSCVIG